MNNVIQLRLPLKHGQSVVANLWFCLLWAWGYALFASDKRIKATAESYIQADQADAQLMRMLARQRRSNNIHKRMALAGYSDCYETKGVICHALSR